MTNTEKLLQIVREITRDQAPINETTCLLHDLSIAGDDAAELLERMHKTFGTSFEGFEFAAYFPDETEAIFSHFGRLLGFASKKKRLSIGHLLSVIERGAWFDEK